MFVRKLNPHLAEVRRLLQAALRQHGGAAAAGGGSAGKMLCEHRLLLQPFSLLLTCACRAQPFTHSHILSNSSCQRTRWVHAGFWWHGRHGHA